MVKEVTEKTFFVCKYKCPYCGEILLSKRKCSELKACGSCVRKFLGKKPIVIKEMKI